MLKFKSYEWDEKNILHILRHGVIPNEVEEACYSNPLIFKTKQGYYLIFGRSQAGKYLSIVIELKEKGIIRTITAREMDNKEKKLFKKRKRK